MSSPSRMVVARQRIATRVSAHAEENADRIGAELAERLAPDAGEVPIDWAEVQRVLVRHLQRLTGDLVTLDDQLIAARSNEREPRRRRDRAAERVRARLVELRRTAEAYFGARSIELVPIAHHTGRQPEDLWRQATHTLQRIQTDDPPPPRHPGGPTDLRPWLVDLETLTTELRTALDDLARSRAENDALLEAKSQALADVDRATRASARLLQGLYRLVGEPGLDERIRRVFRRRRVEAVVDESGFVDGSGFVDEAG